MKYIGSKARYAKYILPLILENRKTNQFYVEPFVGGANLIDKIDGCRIGADINYYLIKLFQAIQNNWIPPEDISEEQYKHIRDNKDLYSPELVAFVGMGCSYSGKWFGGYARGDNDKGVQRNYAKESKHNLLSQKSGILGVNFVCSEYNQLIIPENSIIYCDPPYANTTKYKDSFDNDAFWKWCDNMAENGHSVFVSEYTAPSHWDCIWEKTVCSSLTKDTGNKTAIERLFTRSV